MSVSKTKIVKLSVATLVLAVVFLFLISNRSYAAYDGANVVNNAMFLNSRSMSAAEIQSFLASKGSGLANRSFVLNCYGPDSKERQWYSAVGAPCDQTVPASHIIYYAAQIYGINPQVVLATLQKEQSLVTSTNPTARQIDQAMGYGCPTTGGCGASNFFYQIDSGVWVLRYHYERANGNFNWWNTTSSWVCGSEKNFYKPNLYPNQNVSFYDEDNVKYRTYYLTNAATSSMYCYTPHAYNNPQGLYGRPAFGTVGRYYSGSYNFVLSFEQWWGSTQFPQPTGGMLHYQTSTGKVYLVTSDNNTRYFVPSWSMLQNYRLDRYPILSVDDSTLTSYADGGELTSLIWDGSGVYLINNGIKYHVPSAPMCNDWALACFDSSVTKTLGVSFQSLYLQPGTTLGTLAAYNSVFYKMEGGYRRPIANSTSLANLGYTPQQALYFTAANVSQPLGNLLITTPASVWFGNAVYYFNGIDYHLIPDDSYLRAWGISNILVPPASAYDSTPPLSAIDLSKWYAGGDGSKYLIDHGYRILLNAQQQQLWPGAAYQTFSSPMAEALPQTSLTQFVWASPKIYKIESGEKHYVPTYDDYVFLGINSANTTTIDPIIMNQAPTGSDALGDGRIVAISGGSKVYVVNNHKLLHIPDAGVFGAFGFNWNNIATYGNDVLSDYPEDTSVLRAVKLADGSYSYILNGYRLSLSPSMAASYGLKTNLFKNISSHVSSKMAGNIVLSKFMYNVDDGKIYYASGGDLHHLATYSAFVAYGGTSVPTHLIDSGFINNFVIGDPVY